MDRIVQDWELAGLDAPRLAMLRFVSKLTRTPAAMKKEDVTALTEHGFGDADVLGIVEVSAYFAFANRIVSGLGVELEETPPED
ncbi:MAG: hypothetical protein ACE5F1_05620 [Planctomycetota bacterium]